MRTMRKLLRVLLFAVGLVVMSWICGPRCARAGNPPDGVMSAAPAQESAMPATTCVDRPKGVSAPPRRLAPLPRARKKERDDDDDDKEVARKTAQSGLSRLGFKPVCPQG